MSDTSNLQGKLQPWGKAAIEAEISGLRNRVWSIRLNGERLVARQSYRSAAVLEWELDLLETLRSHGFTVPVPVPTASGARHVGGLAVFTFLSGREPESPADWRLVSAELRRLHQLTRGWRQRPGFRTSRELVTTDIGGDADMSLLPPEDAARCRRAWSELPQATDSVVHGDPSPSNILIEGERVGLLDWDEARVDSPLLDLGALPDAEAARLPETTFRHAQLASVAWEVAVCWQLEPDYVKRRLQELRELSGAP